MVLKWQVITRMNTRSCSYSKRAITAALERAGCVVQQDRMVLDVVRSLKVDEDPKKVREDVTRYIRCVHPKVPYRFQGLFNE